MERQPGQGSTSQTRACPKCGLGVSPTQEICPQDGTRIVQSFGHGVLLDGKYEFLELLGTGGMGVVYKARQVILNKVVAIKMLHGHLMKDRAMMRFQQEGKAASQLSHRNIIQIFDFGITDQDQPYMVMDFVEGQTVADRLDAEGPLPLDFTLWLFMEICDALDHAHSRGVLHRDIKPSNILLTKENTVKILDFGIAKIMAPEGSPQAHLTQTGETMGSPAYMSPEQALGQQLDQRSDLYSLGCTLFECLTRTPPFAGVNAMATIMQQINERPPTLKEATLGADWPQGLEDISSRLLQKDAGQRVQSAAQLQEELRSLRVALRDRQVVIPTVKDLGAKKQSKAPLLWAAAAVMVVAIAVPVSLVFMKADREQPKTVSTEPPLKSATVLNDDELALKKYVDDDTSSQIMNFGDSNVRDEGLAPLARARNCSNLDLHETPVNGEGLRYISDLPLIELRLDNTEISDKSMRHLRSLDKLTHLNLRCTPITGAGLEHLKGKSLSELNLDSSNVQSGELKRLRDLKSLGLLHLNMCKVNDSAMDDIAAIKGLNALTLDGTDITDEGIAKLVNCSTLGQLSLKNTGITDGAVKYLKQIPNLRVIEISGTRITDKGLRNFAGSKSLRLVVAAGCGAELPGTLLFLQANKIDLCTVTGRLTQQALSKYFVK